MGQAHIISNISSYWKYISLYEKVHMHLIIFFDGQKLWGGPHSKFSLNKLKAKRYKLKVVKLQVKIYNLYAKTNQPIFLEQWHFTCVDKRGAVASPSAASSNQRLGGFV